MTSLMHLPMNSRAVTTGLLLAAAMLQCGDIFAAVLRVANDETEQRIRVFDGVTASSAYADASNIGIQLGSVTADSVGNRVFFIGNSGGAQSLYQLNYTTTQQALPQPLSDTLRITHLEWDASGSTRLLGVAIDPVDGSAKLISVQGGAEADPVTLESGCCTFRAGVSAFRSSDDSLFLVGRRSTDAVDQLFRFTMNPPALAQAVAIPADISVLELDLSGSGSLIGLAYSEVAAATKVFTSDAALNLTLLGSGRSDCCFVMAASAAFDTGSDELITLGPTIAGLQPNPPLQWRFNLASGAIGDGITPVNGAGLFVDSTPIVDISVLFEDGFE
jgi:hypothetical protein